MIDEYDLKDGDTNETVGSMEGSGNRAVMVVFVTVKPLETIAWYKRHAVYRPNGLRDFVAKLEQGEELLKEKGLAPRNRTLLLPPYNEELHGTPTTKTWVYELRDELINAKRSYFIVLNGRCVTVFFGRIGAKHIELKYARHTCVQANELASWMCKKREQRRYKLLVVGDIVIAPEELYRAVHELEAVQEEEEEEEEEKKGKKQKQTEKAVAMEEEVEAEVQDEEGEIEEDYNHVGVILNLYNDSDSDSDSDISSSDEWEFIN